MASGAQEAGSLYYKLHSDCGMVGHRVQGRPDVYYQHVQPCAAVALPLLVCCVLRNIMFIHNSAGAHANGLMHVTHVCHHSIQCIVASHVAFVYLTVEQTGYMRLANALAEAGMMLSCETGGPLPYGVCCGGHRVVVVIACHSAVLQPVVAANDAIVPRWKKPVLLHGIMSVVQVC